MENPELNKIYQGDCLDIISKWPPNFIDCCVTSPPYWGLRDYGIEGQLGLEKTPEEYVNKIRDIFWQVRRVLKNEGSLWLNLGDSYAGSGKGHSDKLNTACIVGGPNQGYTDKILKPKDLVGIPWRVAFALQESGWYLRQDIIWHKPNPMPESVEDRCTKAHEYIFLMSKSSKYYYDIDKIREPHGADERLNGIERARKYGYNGKSTYQDWYNKQRQGKDWVNKKETGDKLTFSTRKAKTTFPNLIHPIGVNKRSVWTISTQAFSGAHFATFPEDLIRPCILAGCPSGGIVFDPFMGAGTTALVVKKNGCNFLGCELNPAYIEMANKRISQEYLFNKYFS